MARPLRKVSEQDLLDMQHVERTIRDCAYALRRLGALRAATRVQATVKSVQGALNHATRCRRASEATRPR